MNEYCFFSEHNPQLHTTIWKHTYTFVCVHTHTQHTAHPHTCFILRDESSLLHSDPSNTWMFHQVTYVFKINSFLGHTILLFRANNGYILANQSFLRNLKFCIRDSKIKRSAPWKDREVTGSGYFCPRKPRSGKACLEKEKSEAIR